MKDKVGDILNELYENVQDGEYWDKTMNDLNALMCYREVKGIVFGMSLNIKFIDNYVGYFIRWLGKDYPEQTIREAIEKVKNEQK